MESDNRLTSLENEFKIIKGEIKALLIDIREIMNNIENPFYNTQGTTDGPDTGTKMELGGGAPGRSLQPEDMLEQDPEWEHHRDFAETPVQPMGAGHAPNVAETPMQQGMPMQQMGGTREPYHPGFAEMPVQHDEAKQEATPEHVPDFAEMFKQHEEAKQSEGMPEEIPGIPHDNGFDIHTLAELMRWTDYTLKTIERGRLDELLDLYMLTGHISEGLKDTISKIADLSTQEVAEGSMPTMKDHIAAMFQLNAVLNPSESDQKAIYSIYGELPWRTVG